MSRDMPPFGNLSGHNGPSQRHVPPLVCSETSCLQLRGSDSLPYHLSRRETYSCQASGAGAQECRARLGDAGAGDLQEAAVGQGQEERGVHQQEQHERVPPRATAAAATPAPAAGPSSYLPHAPPRRRPARIPSCWKAASAQAGGQAVSRTVTFRQSHACKPGAKEDGRQWVWDTHSCLR